MPMFTADPERDEDRWYEKDSPPKTPGAGKVEAAGIEPARHALPNSVISRENPCELCEYDLENGLYYGQDEECPHAQEAS